jgi:hypothetical protein
MIVPRPHGCHNVDHLSQTSKRPARLSKTLSWLFAGPLRYDPPRESNALRAIRWPSHGSQFELSEWLLSVTQGQHHSHALPLRLGARSAAEFSIGIYWHLRTSVRIKLLTILPIGLNVIKLPLSVSL